MMIVAFSYACYEDEMTACVESDWHVVITSKISHSFFIIGTAIVTLRGTP